MRPAVHIGKHDAALLRGRLYNLRLPAVTDFQIRHAINHCISQIKSTATDRDRQHHRGWQSCSRGHRSADKPGSGTI